MKYTDENVEAVAQHIVDGLSLKDLMTYVYDDLCAIMSKDEEMFNHNVDHCFDNPNPQKHHDQNTADTR